MSNTPIIARSRRRLRLCWSPFVIPRGYELTLARPSATDPDIGMTDVTGKEGDSLRGFSPGGHWWAVAAWPPAPSSFGVGGSPPPSIKGGGPLTSPVGKRVDAAVSGG